MYGEDGTVKFIDFGFAIQSTKKKQDLEIAGTPYYIAPEVLTGSYGRECDMWSLGVCIYQILTGRMPFDGDSQQEVFGKISKGNFEMPRHISEDCQDLLSKLICVDPTKRITSQQASKHPWILKADEGVEVNKLSEDEQMKLDKDIISNLKQYRGQSVLKKASMNVLVKHLSSAQIESL